MSGARHRRSDSESISEKIALKMSRNLRSFALEVGQNYNRVIGFFTSFWILCSYYICASQCVVQAYLNSLNGYLESCEADIVYHSTSYFNRFYNTRHKKLGRTKPIDGCICGQEYKLNAQSNLIYLTSVSRWLKRKKINASLENATEWDDGTLMWEILKRSADRGDWSSKLSVGRKKENWSLIGAQIKRCYPGLVENQVMLFCLVASKQVSLNHIAYILYRIMNRHKRTWTAAVMRRALRTSEFFRSFLQPRFTVSGSGINHATVNLRNEFIVRTDFPCPSFTVEIHDANGEIWRETTDNARIIIHHGEEYSGVANVPHSQRPIEIVKVSRFLYKVFYMIHTKGECKISIRPGIGKGGHIYGSPFIIPTETTVLSRKPSRDILMARKRSTLKRRSKGSKVEGRTQNGKCANGTAIHNRKQACVEDITQYTGPVKEKDEKDDTDISQVGTFFKRVTDSIIRLVLQKSTESEKMKQEKSNSRTKRRRTLFEPGFSLAGIQRTSTSRLTMPSSRKLKIRNVTIHRYINKPMPSMEEYFFGQNFNVDENGNVPSADDEKRQRGIVRLLRHSLPTNGNESAAINRGNYSNKRASSFPKKGAARNHRLRREGNVYSPPWSRNMRDSNIKYGRGRLYSKDSSSSEGEAFESENKMVVVEENSHKLSPEDSQVEKNDLKYDISPKICSVDRHLDGIHHSVNEQPRNNRLQKDSSLTRPDRRVVRNRRTGYTLVKQHSSQDITYNPNQLRSKFTDFAENEMNGIWRAAMNELLDKHNQSMILRT